MIMRLVLKDFHLLKRLFIFGPIYVFFLFYLLNRTDMGLAAAIPAILLAYIWLITIPTQEDKFKLSPLFLSLPIRRSDYVKAKYAEIFVLALLASVFAFVVSLIYSALGITEGALRFLPVHAGITVLGCALMMSVYYPFYFRFGGAAIQILNFSLIFLSSALIVAGLSLAEDALQAWFGVLRGGASLLLFLGAAGIVAAVTAASYAISLRIVNKKDY